MSQILASFQAPEPLCDLPIWMVWRYEAQYEGDPKPRKMPYYALGNKRVGRQGSPEDRGKLVTFHAARDQAAKRSMDGVGLALLEGGDIVALDFDNCVKNGIVDPVVLALVQGTYAEYSPSGNGVRALLRGNLGNHKSLTDGDGFSFEVFSTSGYVTLTGNMLPFVDLLGHEDTLAKVTPELEAFCAERFGSSAPAKPDPEDFMAGFEPKLGLSVDQSYDLLQQLDPDIGREDWIRVGMALHHEYSGEEDGFDLWNEWSSYGEKYPSEEALRTQWDSFTRRVGPGRKQITMATVKHMVNQANRRHPGVATANGRAAAALPFGQVLQMDATPEDFQGKFQILPASAATARRTGAWLIKGVLPLAELGIIFGASGSGKSFVALDLALTLVRGVDWRGHRVARSQRVLYIAAEGSSGIGGRIKAYCLQHGVKDIELNLGVMFAAPNFMDSVDIDEVINAMVEAGGFDVVVVDTFAQVTPGANENTAEDMGHALRNVRALREATGAMPILVHHAGKDASKGSRGWSGLKAAADVQIEITRHESGGREMRLEKVKDGEDGLCFAFELEVVTLEVDEDGDAVTSCIVTHLATVAGSKRGKMNGPRGEIQKQVLDRAVECGASSGAGALVTDVIDRAVAAIPHDPAPETDGKPRRDQRRGHVSRALTTLCDRGVLVTSGDRVFCPNTAPSGKDSAADNWPSSSSNCSN